MADPLWINGEVIIGNYDIMIHRNVGFSHIENSNNHMEEGVFVLLQHMSSEQMENDGMTPKFYKTLHCFTILLQI